MLALQLLESVQGVQEAIGSNQAEEQPPLPPYPNLTDLSISGKKHFIIVEHLFCHGLKLLSKNYSLVFNTSHVFFSQLRPGELLHGHNSVNFQQILMEFLGMLLIGLEKVCHNNNYD